MFREDPCSPAGPGSASRPAGEPTEADAEPQRLLICRQCGEGITRPDQGISVEGAQGHTFANPHGIVYEIGCFRSADGCAAVGPASDEFTWFQGFSWRIAVCRRCQVHLGWRFESRAMVHFYGLIVDRLILSAGAESGDRPR